MKNNSELQKFIAVLMIFILMIEFSGCYSTKFLTTDDISYTDLYKIHCKNTTYSVYAVEIADSLLTGKLDLYKEYNVSKNKTHIYLSSDSAIQIQNDLISLPIKYITKIEQNVPDTRKTKALTAFLIVAGCVGIGVGIVALSMSVANDLNAVAYPEDGSTGCCSNW